MCLASVWESLVGRLIAKPSSPWHCMISLTNIESDNSQPQYLSFGAIVGLKRLIGSYLYLMYT